MRAEVHGLGHELEESICGGNTASEQRKAEMNGRLRRMTIADIPLRVCREFPSFKLPMEPDWRGHIGSLCWSRAKVPSVAFLDEAAERRGILTWPLN